ncbi:hypothetical protein [Maritalea mediterranea]|uniref:Uncharacterized protein n=1 Tax=Maritalea mediterranea TaxID=2909667 RepID=A0ABS9EB10_9HYPH|nr:hypothetical protein [Maritalea mediterranea]MCF4099369.1 hypothetical protein [Maritalea mediterranea]
MVYFTGFGRQKHVRRSFAYAGFALLASLTTPALAEDSYVEFNSGVSVFKLPSNLFFAEREESSPFARLNNLDTDSGILAGGSLGILFGSALPAPVLNADMSTIEFVGVFHGIGGSSSASFYDAGPGERYGWVEMPYVSGYGTNDGSTLETTTNRTARYIEIEALLKNKFEHAEFFFGPEFRHLNQQLDINGDIVGGSTTVNVMENLSTAYSGVTVGTSFDIVETDGWVVNVKGAVSILIASTQYDADYEDSYITQTANLSDMGIAVGSMAKVSFDKQIGPNTSFGGYANVDFLSYSPQINYGSSPGDPANPVMHIGRAPMFGGSIGVILKHDLN